MIPTKTFPPDGECPDLKTLAKWVEGKLAVAEQDTVRTHTEACDQCSAYRKIMRSLLQLGRSPSELIDATEAEAELADGVLGATNDRPEESTLSEVAADSVSLGRVECPSPVDLLDLEGQSEEIRQHVKDCATCEKRLALIEGLRWVGLPVRPAILQQVTLQLDVFIDETGTISPSYEDERYPFLGLAAVITIPEKTEAIDRIRREVLRDAGLDEGIEIHASPCLHGQGAFSDLPLEVREELLWNFVERNHENYLFNYTPNMLKQFVALGIQDQLGKQGLNQYTVVFAILLAILGKYVEHVLDGQLRVFFDKNEAVLKDLVKVAAALREHPTEKVRVKTLEGEPVPVESHHSAPVQLADVLAHYESRHHLLEVPKAEYGESLEPHREKIEEFYRSLISPKELPWFVPEIYTAVDLKEVIGLKID